MMAPSLQTVTTCFLIFMAIAEFHAAYELCTAPLNAPFFLENPMLGTFKGYKDGLNDPSMSHFIKFAVTWVSGNKFMFGVADLLTALYGSHMQRMLFCAAIAIVLNPIVQLPLNVATISQQSPDQYGKGQEGVDNFSFAFACFSGLAAVAAVCEMWSGSTTTTKSEPNNKLKEG
jgi:hypothetical protein